jgi:hypothetical protein
VGLFGRKPTIKGRTLHARHYCRAPDDTPVYFREVDWLELKSHLQPGDNLLTINKGTGTLFKHVYGRPFTHLAVVYDQDHVVEALQQGVVMSDIDKYQHASFAITRWKGITPAQQEFISLGAQDMIGTEYDVPELGWLIGRGAIDLATNVVAAADLLTGRTISKATWGAKLVVGLMNRRNLLDSSTKVICSGVAAILARLANENGFQPRLPVQYLPGPGCEAPASFANPKAFDWELIHTRKPKPAR